jgi:hypothetical protein
MLDGDLFIGGIRERLTEQSPPYRPIAFVRRAAVDRYRAGTRVDQHRPFQALSPKPEEKEDGPLRTLEHGLFDSSTNRATREERRCNLTRFSGIDSILDPDIAKFFLRANGPIGP